MLTDSASANRYKSDKAAATLRAYIIVTHDIRRTDYVGYLSDIKHSGQGFRVIMIRITEKNFISYIKYT